MCNSTKVALITIKALIHEDLIRNSVHIIKRNHITLFRLKHTH